MTAMQDGPGTPLFSPVRLDGFASLSNLSEWGVSNAMAGASESAPSGAATSWGIPFDIGDVIVLKDESVSIDIDPLKAVWLVFMHTSDLREAESNRSGFYSPMRGEGQLGEGAATYVICYADGSEEPLPIRRRFHLGTFQRLWGEKLFRGSPPL